MTGKHHKWQTAWSRLLTGDLQHASGLVINVNRGPRYTNFVAQEWSLVIFQAQEGARGVCVADQFARLKRLLQEAQEWHAEHP